LEAFQVEQKLSNWLQIRQNINTHIIIYIHICMDKCICINTHLFIYIYTSRYKDWKPFRLNRRYPTNYGYVKMTNWYAYHMLDLKVIHINIYMCLYTYIYIYIYIHLKSYYIRCTCIYSHKNFQMYIHKN
jgi:hypothetical protein